MSIAHLGLADSAEAPRSESYRTERTPPHDLLAEQSALGGMLLSQGCRRRRRRDAPRRRLLHAQARAHLRRDPRALLARRADRRHRRHRRAHQDGRAAARRRRRLPAHADQPRAHRGQRRLLRARSSPSARCCAASSRPARASCRWATPARARSLDLVNNAQAEIYAVTGSIETRGLRSAHRGRRRPRSTRSRRHRSRDGSMTGVPTGFADLDDLTNGLHPGQMIIVAARPGAR